MYKRAGAAAAHVSGGTLGGGTLTRPQSGIDPKLESISRVTDGALSSHTCSTIRASAREA
jgi:hypothetical protein